MSDLGAWVQPQPAVRRVAQVLAVSLSLASCALGPQHAPAVPGKPETANRVRIAECGLYRETCLLLDGVSAVLGSAKPAGESVFGFAPVTWVLPAAKSTGPTSRVLVLFDVSGSMKGAGMSDVRTAVRAFLADLPPSRTRVAVAPFESHDVEARINAAQFGAPADAARELDHLPRPGGNTALFSAVRAGALALTRAGGDGEAHLVVVTDGRNDVNGPLDEPGLLDGPSGLAAAVAAASDASVRVWTVGVGSAPDRAQLAALAGSDDRSQIVASDYLPLAAALQRIAERIDGRFRLVAGTAAAPALALSAVPRFVHVVVSDDGITRTIVGEWRPPLLAPPVVAERVVDAQGPAGPDTNGRILWWRWALLLLPVGIALLVAVPVTLGMEIGVLETPELGEPGSTGPVRASVQEARPRTPDEVTATRLERVVRVPGRT